MIPGAQETGDDFIGDEQDWRSAIGAS